MNQNSKSLKSYKSACYHGQADPERTQFNARVRKHRLNER